MAISPPVAQAIASIAPASMAHAAAARDLVTRHSARSDNADTLARIAGILGGAQHASRPATTPRVIVVVAGDHGGAPIDAPGDRHPTVIAAHAIAEGSAPLSQAARMSEAPIVLINAGAAESGRMPSSAIDLGGEPSRDSTRGPAMTQDAALRALDAGVALAVTLSERAVALIGVGALGVGAEMSASALLRAVAGSAPRAPQDGVELLASFGGPETGVLAGLMLGAASLRIPTILDSYATGAAALVAASFAPEITGYLVAAHRGSHGMPEILAHLSLAPLFDVGLGAGDGTGATMVVPFADQMAALASDSELR